MFGFKSKEILALETRITNLETELKSRREIIEELIETLPRAEKTKPIVPKTEKGRLDPVQHTKRGDRVLTFEEWCKKHIKGSAINHPVNRASYDINLSGGDSTFNCTYSVERNTGPRATKGSCQAKISTSNGAHSYDVVYYVAPTGINRITIKYPSMREYKNFSYTKKCFVDVAKDFITKDIRGEI